jgi:hypothetical protein
MAAAVSEIEATVSIKSLEEARQTPEWLKWQIVIQEELKAFEPASIVERLENRNIMKNKWVFRMSNMQLGNSNSTKQDWLIKDSHKYKAFQFLPATAAQNGWPIDMFDFQCFFQWQAQFWQRSFMEQPQGYEESDQNGMFENYLSHSMDWNRQAGSGMMSFAKP